MEMLISNDWPGNVRELRNVLERAAVLARGPIITPPEIDLATPPPPRRSAPAANGMTAESPRIY